MHREQARREAVEDGRLLSNQGGYDDDVATNDPSATGIRYMSRAFPQPQRLIALSNIFAQNEQDFEILHPDAANNLYIKLATLSEDLLAYSPKACPSWQSDEEEEEDIELENLTAVLLWGGTMYQVLLFSCLSRTTLVLPILFKGRRKGKGGRISFTESSRAFMDFECVSCRTPSIKSNKLKT
ncbi:uncharacterized protein LOC119733089 [Patiria miniata]|uniref:Uncharacterized protein n=1 Tax=Patiria miniata TaxID=46514 RepID=A0A914AFT7_PATMI|nr:uncharacterized protein LOC119733089 [Patiria miniata]